MDDADDPALTKSDTDDGSFLRSLVRGICQSGEPIVPIPAGTIIAERARGWLAAHDHAQVTGAGDSFFKGHRESACVIFEHLPVTISLARRKNGGCEE